MTSAVVAIFLACATAEASDSANVRLLGPAIVGQNSDGRLEVFVKGADGALWHIYQWAGAWSGWFSFGKPSTGFTEPLIVSQNPDGRLEIFVKGNDGALWHIYQLFPSGTWSEWESLGMPSR